MYNVIGQVVATISDGIEAAGYRQVEWNAGSIATGIYFYAKIYGTKFWSPINPKL